MLVSRTERDSAAPVPLAPTSDPGCLDTGAMILAMAAVITLVIPPIIISLLHLIFAFRCKGNQIEYQGQFILSNNFCFLSSVQPGVKTPHLASDRIILSSDSVQVCNKNICFVLKPDMLSCGPSPQEHVSLSVRGSVLQTVMTILISIITIILVMIRSMAFLNTVIILSSITVVTLILNITAIAVFSQCTKNVKIVFKTSDFNQTEAKLSRLI